MQSSCNTVCDMIPEFLFSSVNSVSFLEFSISVQMIVRMVVRRVIVHGFLFFLFVRRRFQPSRDSFGKMLQESLLISFFKFSFSCPRVETSCDTMSNVVPEFLIFCVQVCRSFLEFSHPRTKPGSNTMHDMVPKFFISSI